MMKITLTLLMFSLNFVYALELNEVEVNLPLDIAQLDKSPLKEGDEFITYKLKLYQNTDQDVIQPKIMETSSIQGYMSTLIYSYVNQDKKLFKSLMDSKSAKSIDINSDKFDFSFKFLKKIKKPHLRYVYAYKDGFIVSWSAIGLITDRILFLKKQKEDFKMYTLAVPKDDDLFWNMGLYFKFSPFKAYTPKQPLVKKIGTKIKIDIKVHDFKNWVYLFAGDGKNGKLIGVSDNFPNNKQFKDYNLASKAIELKLDINDLKKLGEKIKIVETTYQVERIGKTLIEKSTPLDLP